MKVCVIQPGYSMDFSKSEENFQREMDFLDQCDSSMDLIVLPEDSDIPCYARTKAEEAESVRKYNALLLQKVAQTAKRCHAMVFVNARFKTEKGYRNTTHAFNRNGEVVGRYFKEHLVPSEISVMELDSGYTFEYSEPTVIEMEGIRFGFLTCYDFYFYENFSNLARQKLDVIIGCSHQRSDTHDALETMTRFLAYNTNTYVVRSSVSMGEDSPLGGASMVVAPTGKVLTNLCSHVGMACVDIDVTQKYYKPAGFGNPPAAHWEYVEQGRRPWKYRPAGSAIVKTNDRMPYPRVCAHRGFNTIAPENSMPAFGAAIALGAEEIEFDLWPTADGEIVSCHDSTLDRVSNGTGKIYEHTLAELQTLDFGGKFSDKYEGLPIVLFEDILKKFAGHCIMNIHIKTLSEATGVVNPDEIYNEEAMKKIVALIRKYDCVKHSYFMIAHDGVIKQFMDYAPDIPMCVGHSKERRWGIVDKAIELGAQKVQLFKPYFNQEMVDKAHAHGILCNVFYADDPEEARRYLDMGIDTILTNDYNRISQVVREYQK